LVVAIEVYGRELRGVEATAPRIEERITRFPHDLWRNEGNLSVEKR
jgi:hypothetical protein